MILIMEGKERQKGRENKGTNERKKGEQLKEIKGWLLWILGNRYQSELGMFDRIVKCTQEFKSQEQ